MLRFAWSYAHVGMRSGGCWVSALSRLVSAFSSFSSSQRCHRISGCARFENASRRCAVPSMRLPCPRSPDSLFRLEDGFHPGDHRGNERQRRSDRGTCATTAAAPAPAAVTEAMTFAGSPKKTTRWTTAPQLSAGSGQNHVGVDNDLVRRVPQRALKFDIHVLALPTAVVSWPRCSRALRGVAHRP